MKTIRRYALGDVHGCLRSMQQIIEKKLRLRKEDYLYLLGDYIDRGPDSKGVLDYIMELLSSGYHLFPLMGNHEFMMIRSYSDREYYRLWVCNGCEATLRSFGIDPGKYPEGEAVKFIPEKYHEFVSRLPYYIATDDYFLVHAGTGMKKNPAGDAETLLWTRDENYNSGYLKGKRVIHGHTPVMAEEIKHRLSDPEEMIYNLDGGCVYKSRPHLGKLVAMDLNSKKLFITENID